MNAGPATPETARDLLEAHWDEARGWCVPNPRTYPHLWLWDSCFHAIVWAHLGDARALRELTAVVDGRTSGGMVPHMRYGGEEPDTWLGPLATSSSLTQPPLYGHAARVLASCGIEIPAALMRGMRAALDWLWDRRRTSDGLLYVVHPWEAGNDHSPRWDGWGAPGRTRADYDQTRRSDWNKALMHHVRMDADGAAIGSDRFEACPAAFNAYAAFSMAELGTLTGDEELTARSGALAEAMDSQLWDDRTGLWTDLALVGGGESTAVPTSDGVMPALVSADEERSMRALAALTDPDRFGAPYGPANVARRHPAYDPDSYWRGPAWPPLNYLAHLALRRWGLAADARTIAAATRAAVARNGWAEYWNPETGAGLGAAPQTWSGLAVAMIDGRES